MEDSATLRIANENYTFPLMEGSEGEQAIDTRTLRAKSGFITYDEGYGNTGSCESKITFIDGEKGILRYRGFPIEQLAESSTFIEAAYLIVYGELPGRQAMKDFSARVLRNARIDVGMHRIFEGFPHSSHPMAMLSAMLNSLGCYYPSLATNDRARDLEHFDEATAILLSKVRTLAAMSYRMKSGLPFVYPKHSMGYCQNFLHMLFSEPYHDYIPHDDVVKALDLIFLLHADHEQNCSTSTVRMVASGGANLFASVSAGVCALWGPLHGGANMAVVNMLKDIHNDGDDGTRFIEAAKKGEARLMGFGHRVYKNYDPRATAMQKTLREVFEALETTDPVFEVALQLEEIALNDDY
ncbi:MAG: citrate/2-methylcitrate synthase, partial [Verrucomicrobiota bacterium]